MREVIDELDAALNDTLTYDFENVSPTASTVTAAAAAAASSAPQAATSAASHAAGPRAGTAQAPATNAAASPANIGSGRQHPRTDARLLIGADGAKRIELRQRKRRRWTQAPPIDVRAPPRAQTGTWRFQKRARPGCRKRQLAPRHRSTPRRRRRLGPRCYSAARRSQRISPRRPSVARGHQRFSP